MDGQNLLALMNRQTWLKQVKDTNQYTKKFGLTLSEKDTEILLAEKNHPLKTERRVEFGPSILPQIIFKWKTVSDIESIVQNCIKQFTDQFFHNNTELYNYLCCEARNTALRIHLCERQGKLNNVFIL